MKKIKGVVFDFDGTIVSHEINFKEIKEKIIKEAKNYKLKIPPSKNIPVLELIEKIKKLNPGKFQNFVNRANKILIESEIKASNLCKPVKGAIELLKKLKQNGIKIGIITRNCKMAVENAIKKWEIPYDIILTRDDVKRVKPSEEHLEKAIKLLSLKKEEVILAGDNHLDIRCGKKLGVISVGVNSDSSEKEKLVKEKADFITEDIRDVEIITGIKGFPPGKLPNRFLRYLLEKYTIKDKNVIVPPDIGIDCAIFKTDEKIIFSKTDPITLTFQNLGFYLVNINTNDIVAMGGIPQYFLSVLLFPSFTKFYEIENVFFQIYQECKKLNIKWIGGHTEIVDGISFPIGVGFLIGKKIKNIKRKEIKPGDKVFLVKPVGIEAGAIIATEKYDELKKYFSEKYLKNVQKSIKKPGISIYKEGKILWENFDIKVMHDPTEGGISTALYEISQSKNVGILIYKEKLNFYPPTLKFCKIFNLNPLGIISSGCIIGIISKNDEKKLIKFAKRKKLNLRIIGKVIKEKGVFYKEEDQVKKLLEFSRDEINKLLTGEN